jgi:hypothetical protein
MKVGDLVRYIHKEDRDFTNTTIGIVIRRFQRNTDVLWGCGRIDKDLDAWGLEVINEKDTGKT